MIHNMSCISDCAMLWNINPAAFNKGSDKDMFLCLSGYDVMIKQSSKSTLDLYSSKLYCESSSSGFESLSKSISGSACLSNCRVSGLFRMRLAMTANSPCPLWWGGGPLRGFVWSLSLVDIEAATVQIAGCCPALLTHYLGRHVPPAARKQMQSWKV